MAIRTKWAGPGHDGKWFDAANWAHGVPSQDQRAVFKGGGTYTVSLGGRLAQAASMIVAHDHLTLTGGRLRLDGHGGTADLSVKASAVLTIGYDAAVSTTGSIEVGTTFAEHPISTTGTILLGGILRTGYLNFASGLVDVAAGAFLQASAGIDVTPLQDLGLVSTYATLHVEGRVTTSEINAEQGTIDLDGSSARLNADSCMTNGDFSIADGAWAHIDSMRLGAPFGASFGSLRVDGSQSRLIAGTISVGPGEANGSLSVQNGGQVSAATVDFGNPNTDGYITVSGADSSLNAGTLTFGTYDNNDIFQLVQNGTVSLGNGGLTLNDGTLALDLSGLLKTPFIASQGGAIDALAGAGAVVTIAAPLVLGYTTDIHKGTTTLSSEPGAVLNVTGAITGAAGTVLDIGGGSVILANPDNATGAIQIEGGRLELASPGAAGAGPLTFLNVTDTTSALVIDSGNGLANAIGGFASPDSIDLSGFAFMAGINSDFADGTLTMQNGSMTASIVFAGEYNLMNFMLQADDHGGTMITYHA